MVPMQFKQRLSEVMLLRALKDILPNGAEKLACLRELLRLCDSAE